MLWSPPFSNFVQWCCYYICVSKFVSVVDALWFLVSEFILKPLYLTLVSIFVSPTNEIEFFYFLGAIDLTSTFEAYSCCIEHYYINNKKEILHFPWLIKKIQQHFSNQLVIGTVIDIRTINEFPLYSTPIDWEQIYISIILDILKDED